MARTAAGVTKLRKPYLRPVDDAVVDDLDDDGAVIGRRCRLCHATSGPLPKRLRHLPHCPVRRQKNAHGQGSRAIYKPKENRWWISLTMPDGTRKQFYGRTAAEATRKRDRARAQVDRGLPLPDERLTTGDWLQRWFDNTHVKEVKPSTIRYQRSILTRHLLPFFGSIPLVRLTGDDVDRYIERKLAEGITPSVVGTHRGMLRKAIQAAGREDRVARNVVDFTITPKRKRHAQRPTFTKDQVLAFLQLIRGHPLEGVFLFGMTLGLRIGEATGVMWEDVDLEHRLFFLRHQVAPDIQADGGECLCGTRCGRAALVEDLKSESSTRGLKLPAVIVPALRRQLARNAHARELRLAKGKEWLEHGLVFPSAWGNPMQPTRVRAWLRPLCKAAGLPPCRFHDLRHAWGSLMKSAGVSDEDLAQAMGHASAQVTKRTYLHALPDSAVRVTSVVDELLPPDPANTLNDSASDTALLSLRIRRPTIDQNTQSAPDQC